MEKLSKRSNKDTFCPLMDANRRGLDVRLLRVFRDCGEPETEEDR